jgi:nucleoside-diphosphate-sugar epimerase
VLALRVLEFFHLSPLYEWAYGTVTEDSFVSIEKARQVLGFEPHYSNKDALLRNYQWYLDNQARFQHTSGISHRVPWKQGLLGFAKLFF